MSHRDFSVQSIQLGSALVIVSIGAITSALLQPIFFFFIPVSIALALVVVAIESAWFRYKAPLTVSKRSVRQLYLWALICLVFFAWAALSFYFTQGAFHLYLFEYVNSYLALPLLLLAWIGLFMLLAFQSYRIGLPLIAICTPCVFLGSVIVFDIPFHQATIDFGGHTYHVAVSIDDRYWGSYLLYECAPVGIVCRGYEIYETGTPGQAALVVENNRLMVNVRTTGADETVYTLDAAGHEWCASEYYCSNR